MALKRLLQIGVIVEDADKTKQILTEKFGFTDWAPDEGLGGKLTDYAVNGVPAKLDNNVKFCTAFGLEWEFIEPKSGPLKTWLEEHGPGIHHIAVIDDRSYGEFRDLCKELSGKDVFLNGTAPSIGMDYSYYDLSKEIGMFVEVYNEERVHTSGFNIDAPSGEL